MKKLAILSALALCLGFASCDDNDIIGIPENPEPAIFAADGLVLTPTEASQATIDLQALTDAGQQVELSTLSLTNFPEDYDLKLVLQVAKDESFSKLAEVETSIDENGVVTVKPADLESAFVQVISKGPKEKTIYSRYAAYAVKDNTTVRIGDPTTYFNVGTINVLPLPSSLVIEDNYYLLGTINGWSVATAVKFNHSDTNPYDDPVFTLKVDISADEAAAGWWWKVVPESVYNTGDWGSGANSQFGVAENGDEALNGMLIAATADSEPGAGCIKESGPFLITLNLEDGTYDFSLAIDNLWTPGNSNGWSHGSAQMLYTEDYTNYYGYAHLNGDFKFTSQAGWSGINYGSAGEDGKLSNDGGAGNLSAPADALYWCSVNIANLTYSLYQVNTIGVIGDATPNGWDASTALTSTDFLVWEGDVNFNASGEWKLRANDAWDVNLGGTLTNLVQGGANLPTPGAGVHHVTLDLSTLPYAVYID